MWNIASHAGTGLAVAGLSATYYALARKNYQLEKDSGSAGDQSRGDGEHGATLSASQLLLKKEFDNLARESGHSIGLNGVNSHEKIKPPSHFSSEVDLRQIVSRINTSSQIKVSHVISVASHEDTTEDSTEMEPREAQSHSSGEKVNDNDSRSVFDVEEFSRLEISEDDVTNEEENSKNSDEKPLPESFPKNFHPEPLGEIINPIQRTPSPILYYKNTVFGKRFACKMPETIPLLPQESESEQMVELKGPSGRKTKTYKDSTQFLFPPVLSESKVSICDEEEERSIENLEGELQQEFDQSIEENETDKLVSEGLSRMDEIRDYNLQLQVMHDVRNADDKTSFDTENIDSSLGYADGEYSKDPEKIEFSNKLFFDETFIEKVKVVAEDKEAAVQENPKEEEPIAEVESSKDFLVANDNPSTSSGIVNRILETSWISIPARLYAESEQADKPLITFLSLVVFLFGLMGKFFIELTGWFEKLPSIEDEINPSAMLEH